jgi:hypothetical protein
MLFAVTKQVFWRSSVPLKGLKEYSSQSKKFDFISCVRIPVIRTNPPLKRMGGMYEEVLEF